MSGNCWLCDKPAELCQSHIIPKFVFRWLIDTGGSPYLRSGSNPNKRLQDGDKHYLYCKNCEDRLSRWENDFSRKIFSRATKREDLRGPYSHTLSRFAASLAFRALQSQKIRGIYEKYDDNSRKLVIKAEKQWKSFLLGDKKHPDDNKLFMIYLGYFDNFDAEDLPPNWNSWVHRSVERDVIYSETGQFIATFSKLGPLIFIGKIFDKKQILGEDYLRCGDGYFDSPIGKLSQAMFNFFIDRAANVAKVSDSISPKQRQKIIREVEAKPEHFLNSEQAKVMLDDLRQFGTGSRNKP